MTIAETPVPATSAPGLFTDEVNEWAITASTPVRSKIPPSASAATTTVIVHAEPVSPPVASSSFTRSDPDSGAVPYMKVFHAATKPDPCTRIVVIAPANTPATRVGNAARTRAAPVRR